MGRTVTFKGGTMHLLGAGVQVGDQAPDATLTRADFSPLTLASLRGKVVLVSVTPSLDTPVCDLQAQRLNSEAAGLGEHVAVVNVSLDLPPAIKRWCGATGSDQIVAASDYANREFGLAFGLLIDELKLLTRAIVVLDAAGKVVYQEIVPEVTSAPDYDAALAAVRAAL